MNTDGFYRHHPDHAAEPRQDPPAPAPTPAPAPEVSPLAVHGDPSQAAAPTGTTPEPTNAQRAIQWVRPSELPTMLGGRYVRKGMDAQAQLTRRVRRATGMVASRGRVRISRTAIGHSDALNRREGGIGL